MLHKNRCWWDMETIIDFCDQWIRNILNEIKTKNSRKVSPSFIKWLFEQVFRLPSKFCICFKGNSTIAFYSLWSFQDFILNDLNPNLWMNISAFSKSNSQKGQSLSSFPNYKVWKQKLRSLGTTYWIHCLETFNKNEVYKISMQIQRSFEEVVRASM